MALSIKNPEVEALAAMTGESTTTGSDFLRYLAEEVWPKAPPGQLGRRLSREEENEILGYGPAASSGPQLW